MGRGDRRPGRHVAVERSEGKSGRLVRGRATVTSHRTVIVGRREFRASRGLVPGYRHPADEATTGDLIVRHGLRFPVGHSADAAAIARATAHSSTPDPPYLQSTGFVLDPGGRVIVSVYSSGAIGRLVPQDVAGLAGYLREHTQAS
jgi:hypothetical protein